MKSYYTHVVAAFFAVFTLILTINPVSAFAGTDAPKKPVAPPEPKTSAKKVVEGVNPAAPPPPAPVAKPAPPPVEPRPTPAEIAAAPKAERAVTESDFHAAIVTLTRLAEQGVERDKEQDARLTKLEQRVDEVPCLIQEAVGEFELRLAKTEELVLKKTDELDVRLKKVEGEVLVLQKSEELRLATSTTATAVATSSSATVSTPSTAPQIIVVPIQGMTTQCPPTASTTKYSTTPSCTTSRTTVLKQAPPIIPEKVMVRPVVAVKPPPAPYYDDGRPGLLVRAWRGLFGGGTPSYCPPTMNRMPVMPTRNYCAPPSCVPPRQVCATPPRCQPQPWCPPTFGWQQYPPVQRPSVIRGRCGPPPNYGGGYSRGGGGGGPTRIYNRNVNDNLIHLRL